MSKIDPESERERSPRRQPEGRRSSPGESLSAGPDDAATSAAAALLPDHVEDTIQAVGKLHADHDRQATPMEKLVDRLTGLVAEPAFGVILTLIVVIWTAGNLSWLALGHRTIDPPPFSWLQGALTLGAVCMTSLILTTQRRADRLASHREQLTLQLVIMAEKKNAKIIDLLEELRRDSPMIHDRSDAVAEQMSTPADPGAVLEAIKETHDQLRGGDGGGPSSESLAQDR